ncbi:MAG: hypothetical protein MUQ26_04895 [Armatimonadetes bacterium]|nr:hypothetical protein [Armatimonadota bacterium]
MNWRLKSALRHLTLAAPGGARLYRWLTYELLGTMSGMAAKWFRVFPTRVALLQEFFGSAARDQPMWCFDCGTTIAPGLAMAIATDRPGLLTDRHCRLSSRYCEVSRRVAEQKGPQLAALSHAPTGRVAHVLDATAGKRALRALKAIGMSYFGDHAALDGSDWVGAIACVFSGGALEHYRADELEQEAARMARLVRRGGVLSHVVDHRDHRWHADKRISPLQHLTLGEGEYLRRFANPIEYHNRWLRSRYVDLFTRHGFRVEARDVMTYTPDLVPLDRSGLASPFQDVGDGDLSSLVTHFVAVRL